MGFNSGFKGLMGMDHWWNDTDRDQPNYWKK